jgi:hypothetical protein
MSNSVKDVLIFGVVLGIILVLTIFAFSSKKAEGGDLDVLTLSSNNTVILNTPIDGNSIIETAKGLKNPVHTISKFSASMGFIISQYLNTRYVLYSSTMMSHRASISGLSGNVPGSALSRLGSILTIVQKADAIASKRSGMSVFEYQKLIADELWLDSFKAVGMKFADERIRVRCDESLNGTYLKTVDLFIIKAVVEFSKCPLIDAPVSISFQDGALTKYYEGKGTSGTAPSWVDIAESKDVLNMMLTDRSRYYQEYIKTGLHNKYFH